MTQLSDAATKPVYRLQYDALMDNYTIERVEVIGSFATREEARQYMIDTEAERKARDSGGTSWA